RTDELVVVDKQDPRHAGPEAGEQDRQEPDQPDIITKRIHPTRLVAGAAQASTEWRAYEHRHADEGQQEDDERREVERRRAREAHTERRRARAHIDAVVAV